MGALLHNKYLFVHINKSAGGIITKNMSLNGKLKIDGVHRTLADCLNIAKHLNINTEDLHISTSVRNPWDRMLSLYLFYKYKHRSPEFYSGNPSIDDSFNEWIKFIYSNNFNRNLTHGGVNVFKHCFSNQLNWLKDKNGQLIPVDKILRHEEYSAELEPYLRDILKLETVVLERVHATKHDHYSTYYNNTTRDLVAEHYAEDIEYFNYTY